MRPDPISSAEGVDGVPKGMTQSPTSDRLIDWWPEFEQVKRLWLEGRVAEADGLLRAEEARWPDSPVLLLVRGVQMLQEDFNHGSARRTEEIARLVNRAAGRMPGNAHAQLVAAEVMVDLEEYTAAARYIRTLRPHHGDLVEPGSQAVLAYVMGRLCEEGGKRDLALNLYREAVAQDPTDDRYRRSLEDLTGSGT